MAQPAANHALSADRQRTTAGMATAATARAPKPTACVIWLHGTGGCGAEFDELFAFAQRRHPTPWIRFVCPTASDKPYTLFGGESLAVWFDRDVLGLKCKEDRKGIAASVALVDALLEQHAAPLGITRERTIVGGFSQGGGLALYTAFGPANTKPFAACITSGAFLPDPSMLIAPHPTAGGNAPTAELPIPAPLRSTPLLMIHGTHDPVVPYINGLSTHDRLSDPERGGLTNTTWIKRERMVHEVDQQAESAIMQFIQKILPEKKE